jgi:omega-6 fatty acid desaturase (delta-12 desaturase)
MGKGHNDGIKARQLPDSWVDGTKPADGQRTDPPPFTIGDVKRSIPDHCFKRNTLKSMQYTIQDLIMAGMLLYCATLIDQPSVPFAAKLVLWPMYWWCQGAVCTGLWVIAHECGHRAFSDNIAFGDLVGMVLHSLLLVPYHPWRISHAKHHRSTNDMDRDEVFIPYTLAEYGGAVTNPADDMPGPLEGVTRVAQIAKMLTFGWPAYLVGHVTGRRYSTRVSHFEPSAELFDAKDYWDVVKSDVVLSTVVAGLGYLGYTYGIAWLTCYYLMPYLFVNMWLVMYTDLQHTDVRIPHYRGKEWNWLQGALCTMDRDYGIYNILHHHIGDTHVCHHMFSYMPHYNAEEATAAMRPVLGEYYLIDDKSPGFRGVLEALWETASQCRYVNDEGGVLWWHRDPASSVAKKATKAE